MSAPDVGPIVEVEWVDSAGIGDWAVPDETLELLDRMTCHSAGFLVGDLDDPRGIILALGTGEVGQYLSTMAIPRAAIVSVKVVRR